MAATAMDDMADRFADRGVTSVFVYTREAHPAENYRHHTSMEVKRRNARAFVELCEVRRPVLLDEAVDEVPVRDAAVHEREPRLGRQVLGPTSREVVDGNHFVVASEKQLGHV